MQNDHDKIPPAYFYTDADYLRCIEKEVNQYVDMRAKFYSPVIAFLEVFGEVNRDQHLLNRIAALESTDAFKRKLAARKASIKVSELATEGDLVADYLRLARSHATKESVRVSALKEVAVLMGITVIDEKGHTRNQRGMSLDEFYKTHGISTGPTSQERIPGQREHSEPAKPAQPLH